jgi:hypothetical protein
MTILPIDEINALEDRLRVHFNDEGKIKSKQDAEDIIDELLDLFLLSYAMGVDSVGVEQPPLETVEKTLYERIDGETWVDRVWDYYDNGGTVYDIARIGATEAHRDANAAAYDAARNAGMTKKVWHCMKLDTSRDTHVYLDGVTVPIDGSFYSYKGGQTLYPGQWGIAEEDCNCLCWLTYE